MIKQIIAVGSNFNSCLTIANLNVPGRPLLFVNDSFIKVTGYDQEFSIGKNCSFLQGKLTDQKKVEFIRQSFNAKNAFCADLVNYRKNGKPFWNRLIMFPIEDKGVLYYVGLQNDVTHIKSKSNTESDLESVCSSEICHKIKNPLAVILGFTQLIQDANFSQTKAIELQHKIEKAISKIDDFVINLESASEFEKWSY